jgi:DUF1365 family protein
MKSGFLTSFVKHIRFIPKKYSFGFSFFWTRLDLDELDFLEKNTFFFSRNSFNLISFYDHDHIYLGHSTLKENISEFLKENQVTEKLVRIELVTNPRILGYTFNPVSFYFIETETCPYIIIEIGNTFGEQKPYLLRPDCKKDSEWIYTTPKNFYISPFASVENSMTFRIKRGDEKINITIDDHNKDGDLEIKTIYQGEEEVWSHLSILKNLFKFPFITLQIIISIHYHALRLYLKKIPYFKKSDESELQTNLFIWKENKFQRKP